MDGRGSAAAFPELNTTLRHASPGGAGMNSIGTPRVAPPGSERTTCSTRCASAATGVTKIRGLPRVASTTKSPANLSASGVNPRPAQSSTGQGKSISTVFPGSVGSATGRRSSASAASTILTMLWGCAASATGLAARPAHAPAAKGRSIRRSRALMAPQTPSATAPRPCGAPRRTGSVPAAWPRPAVPARRSGGTRPAGAGREAPPWPRSGR